MKRRDFLRSAGLVSASMAFPKSGRLFAQGTAPDTWRTFDVTTISGREAFWHDTDMDAGGARRPNTIPEDPGE